MIMAVRVCRALADFQGAPLELALYALLNIEGLASSYK
jgi:hypothetical protein